MGENTLYDVVIIGGGPAGLTAAIYASRANLSVLILDGGIPGGKLTKTYEIENYPGIDKISGFDLAEQLKNHSTRFGAKLEYGEVTSINIENGIKTLTTLDGRKVDAKVIIVATGTKEKELNIPRAAEFTGMGISYCAVCDGAFYRNKTVTVIGGGNSALEEALYLTGLVSKVNIVIRRDVFRAEANIQERVRSNPKINIITKHIPEELIIENGRITGIVLSDVETKEKMNVECSGIFPYIGAEPATAFLPSEILNERGYVIVNENMETAINGIYAAGDVIAKGLRQVVTACNDGAIAANSAVRYLQNR